MENNSIENALAQYSLEARERYGETNAYKQSKKRIDAYNKADWQRVLSEMNALLKLFSEHIGEAADSAAVQELVAKWQAFITKSYYDCTDELLAGLGELYALDSRFAESMDIYRFGTAKLMSDAIAVYCKK